MTKKPLGPMAAAMATMVLVTLDMVSANPRDNPDPWAYLDNGVIRIGVDKSRGAAIGYFALGRDGRNLLNHYDEDYGIGICTPGTNKAVAYRFSGNGKTGPDGSACSYVAPVRTLALKKSGAIDYQFFLTIGTLEEIRSRFAKPRK